MHLIRAATVTVSNLNRSIELYSKWLDYNLVEQGQVSDQLAMSWGTPLCAGASYAVLQPQSGARCYLRFIEQPSVESYRPLRSYGWAAIEICNQDTDGVHTRLESSPFEIIGPPKELDGMSNIYPMQIKGPDGEIVYLTEIREQPDGYKLQQAQSYIDQIFILVLACRDHEMTAQWLETQLGLTPSGSFELIYSMINKAFELPDTTKHAIATVQHEDNVFLEIDTYPDAAITRPQHAGWLPPCAAISSFIHPNFDDIVALNLGNWLHVPVPQQGAIYGGARVGTLAGPDGALFEIIEG